jgi:putative ubiquitin-RnfH superfamily antitoxin RatB of RatAB toxin-antitoxin module
MHSVQGQKKYMVAPEKIDIEIAYALPDKQAILTLQVDYGTTIQEAIAQSDIAEMFPGIDLEKCKVGIFGKLRKPDDVLSAGDRIEIYRPLIADPKEVRRQRAAQGKVMKKGAAASGNQESS